MTSLADFLSDNDKSQLARQTIKIGDVYQIAMNHANGITPKNGDAFRNKFFVVLGFDEYGNAYGGVVINSNINLNTPPALRYYYMPIKSSKYSFLNYDSFVDCTTLKVVNISKFSEWVYLGKIDVEDVGLIIGTIKESPRENEAHLSMYGI